MGVVWRARDELLERDVAIKMVLPCSDAARSKETAARFLIEAKAAAAIQSRHVAHVLQLGTTAAGEVYIVLELLTGKTLLEILERERTLPTTRAVRIARHVAKGMEAAHSLGIVHRDLKPANVMLVRADGEAEVAKILDFGVAKRTRSADLALTEAGAIFGTLQFMAPEQLNGLNVDPRSDVYALGVVLYRMLAGQTPFEAELIGDLAVQIVKDRPRPLRFHGVPEAIDAIVLRCLEKKPADRFPTMSALDAALLDASWDLRTPSSAEPISLGGRRPAATLTTLSMLSGSAGHASTAPFVPDPTPTTLSRAEHLPLALVPAVPRLARRQTFTTSIPAAADGSATEPLDDVAAGLSRRAEEAALSELILDEAAVVAFERSLGQRRAGRAVVLVLFVVVAVFALLELLDQTRVAAVPAGHHGRAASHLTPMFETTMRGLTC